MSRSMHALQLVKYGSPKEAVTYNEEVPIPQIKSPNEVLVRVKAAGVNPIESKASSGNMSMITSFAIKLPAIIGADFSGIVEEKGENVTDFQVGDEVFGSLQVPFGLSGSFAQYTVVDTTKASIAKKPSNLSFEQAASAGIAALTAYQAMINSGRLSETPSLPRKVLITGASGGVGSFAVQFAKAVNKENFVVGICSARNAEFVKSLGADKVIDYNDEASYQSFIDESKNTFDVVFECIGGDAYYKQLDPLLTKKGVFVTPVGPIAHFGSSNVGITQVATAAAKLAYIKLFGAHTYNVIAGLPHSEWRSKIAPYFESGAVHGGIKEDANIIPLAEGYQAFEKINSHRTVGKIVYRVD